MTSDVGSGETMSVWERLRGRAGDAARRNRARLHTDLHVGLLGLGEQLAAIQGELERLRVRVDGVEAEARSAAQSAGRAAAIGRHAFDEEPANRRRLHELRRSPDYELAFTEAEPLVSFLVPTHTSFETLRDVALPSILGQGYRNLEVIVVGDCAPPQTAEAIAELDDDRVTYINRTIRGPYEEDSLKRWYTIGVPPCNEALAVSRGRWIAILGDDDAVRPDHTERLLAAAQENRFEHCYGRMRVEFADADPVTIGSFPPALGEWGIQAALYHAGLRFFEGELSDAIYDEPSDWSKCRRMVRAGVRFGMIDEVVVDKHGMGRSI